MAQEVRYIERPPRIQPDLPQGSFNLPTPPDSDRNPNNILMQIALPLIMILGYVMVALFGQGRSLLLIIPMGLAAVGSTAMSIMAMRTEKRQREDKEKGYTQRLAELRKDLEIQHEMQRIFYTYNYPDVEQTIEIVNDLYIDKNQRTQDIRSGTRLWERRTSDVDFACINLGKGTIPSTFTYKMPDVEKYDNPQIREVLRLSEDSQYIQQVPIIIPLRHPREDETGSKDTVQESGPSIKRHAIGITGINKYHIYQYVWSILADYTSFHSPNDTQLFIIGSNQARDQWRWAYSLPHCKQGEQNRTLMFESDKSELDENETDKMRAFLKEIRKELEHRKIRLEDREKGGDITIPFLFFIIDVLDPVPFWSTLKDLESDATIATILQDGKQLGAAVIFLLPDRSLIPSNCQAVLEVEQNPKNPDNLFFRYAEIDLNTLRYVGQKNVILTNQTMMDFAKKLEPLAVRRNFGADLASSVSFMEMMNTPTIHLLKRLIKQQWNNSKAKELADWTFADVGLLSGNEVRKLVFSAKSDGVHGLIAGSTGSGKSELLTTLILSLAVNFDPSIVNFVLVDYKGGAAFEPFKNLPHCVDIVTNLEGSATARMFASINAEMDRRQRLNTLSNSKDIVHYRKKGLHLEKNEQPYPHLFIIIDEFAEMIAGNPEFKAQLESITRLGRALGVSLILAAQRPIGVTDQMRANIKFRICLRVETPDDSRELLRRSDAAYLPPGIPGRGYLQVGNENIELIQTAWAGADYRELTDGEKSGNDDSVPLTQSIPNVIWLNRPKKSHLTNEEAPKVYEVVIENLKLLANELSEPQWRPWPAFLPKNLTLESMIDAAYLDDDAISFVNPDYQNQSDKKQFVLNKAISQIFKDQFEWPQLNWAVKASRPVIGLIDNPYEAKQLPLVVNFPNGHGVLFGASGWGKTTFIRTLLLSLVTTHSPDELNVYILEFGGRSLALFEELPHVGAVINGEEEERIQRLLRKLNTILEERQRILSEDGANDIYTYNQNHPENILPAILLMMDNFAEFQENFESLLPNLIGLARESRAYGIHLMITANQPNIPGKLFNLLTERFTLRLSDSGDYGNVVGRGNTDIGEIYGRGLVKIGKRPLEFQTALPVFISSEDGLRGVDETQKIKQLVQILNNKWANQWKYNPPEPIATLDTHITLEKLLNKDLSLVPKKISPPIAIDDRDLKPFLLDLEKLGPNLLLIGPPNSGKTTCLRTIALSLAWFYSNKNIKIVLIDFQRRFFRYGGTKSLVDLPQVVETIYSTDEFENFYSNLKYETEKLRENSSQQKIFVLIDNYDSFVDEVYRANRDLINNLATLVREYASDGLHFIGCGSPAITGSTDELRRQIMASSFGIALQSAEAATRLNGRVPRSLASAELPMGRAFVIKSGRTHMIQFATPYNDDLDLSDKMDEFVGKIQEKFGETKASWSRSNENLPEKEENFSKELIEKYSQFLLKSGSVDEESIKTWPVEDIIDTAKIMGFSDD